MTQKQHFLNICGYWNINFHTFHILWSLGEIIGISMEFVFCTTDKTVAGKYKTFLALGTYEIYTTWRWRGISCLLLVLLLLLLSAGFLKLTPLSFQQLNQLWWCCFWINLGKCYDSFHHEVQTVHSIAHAKISAAEFLLFTTSLTPCKKKSYNSVSIFYQLIQW